MRKHTWEISDEFWALVEPLIPPPDELREKDRQYQRQSGAGCKRKNDERSNRISKEGYATDWKNERVM